jgi:Mg-chelatase subunit ChlD
VIDTSMSMLEPSGGGRSKFEAAKEAAMRFLESLDVREGYRVAIVSFNSSARAVQGLTNDTARLTVVVDQLAVAAGSLIHLGIEAAENELRSVEQADNRNSAIIVLSDERRDSYSPQLAIEAANRLEGRGTSVLTVGLGVDRDHETLRSIASKLEFNYSAPDGEGFNRINGEMFAAIACEMTDRLLDRR